MELVHGKPYISTWKYEMCITLDAFCEQKIQICYVANELQIDNTKTSSQSSEMRWQSPI